MRGNEAQVCSEAWYLLGEAGDDTVIVDKTGISGLVAAKTSLSPIEAVQKLRVLLRDRPSEFRYILRIIPIQEVVDSNIPSIVQAVSRMTNQIHEDETFRITVEKRHSAISRKELINEVAAVVERKVNLTKPDKILLIQVVGGRTGISIVEASGILSTTKERTF
ncbi:MAG: THUMP domain-containing protein [Candidatus Bathyarchaeota archaeon]|nr:THUMP domain-containing protein [Candidatus Bathyarchaeota archaeon]